MGKVVDSPADVNSSQSRCFPFCLLAACIAGANSTPMTSIPASTMPRSQAEALGRAQSSCTTFTLAILCLKSGLRVFSYALFAQLLCCSVLRRCTAHFTSPALASKSETRPVRTTMAFPPKCSLKWRHVVRKCFRCQAPIVWQLMWGLSGY